MKIIPTKALVCHTPESTSTPPCDSWLQYWSETLGVEVPKSGYVKCDCCEDYHPIEEFVGAHVTDVLTSTVYIYPTCDTCNKKYKESRAPEGVFYALIEWLCPIPPKQDSQSDE